MARDPDATPIEGIGALRLLADQANGNDEETKEVCPRCDGKGEVQHRVESHTGYSVLVESCWLCSGRLMVTHRVAHEFRRLGSPR